MKDRKIISWSLALLLAALALAACRPAAGPAPTAAGDWTAYRDEASGCSLRYPADAYFEHGVSKYGISTMRLQFKAAGEEGYQGMVLRAVPRDAGANMETLLNQVYASGAHEISFEEWRAQLADVTVNGEPAFRTHCSIEGGDFAVIIPHEKWVYVASPTHHQAAACSDARTLELFYAVLGTLALE